MTILSGLERLLNYKTDFTHTKSTELKNFKTAAVLVILLKQDDGIKVVLTVRSRTLSRNPGDVAFPGGKVEDGDEDIIETALRETREEINLSVQREDVLMAMEPVLTWMGIIVYPVVALMMNENYHPVCNEQEVQQVFTVPLEFFFSSDHHKCTKTIRNCVPWIYHEFEYDGFHIWALTAHILINLASIFYLRKPVFKFDYTKYTTNPLKSKI